MPQAAPSAPYCNHTFHPGGRVPTRQPLYVSSSTQYLTLPDGNNELVPYPREAVNPFLTGVQGRIQGITAEFMATVTCAAMVITVNPCLSILGAGGRLTRHCPVRKLHTVVLPASPQ